ncbi:tyrosine recombinase XerC [Spirochaetota bacterium]
MEYTFPVPLVHQNSRIGESISDIETTDIGKAVEGYFNQYSKETVKAYKADLKTWLSVCRKNVHEATEKDIIFYINSLDKLGFKNSTINRKLASLSKIFSVYIALGITNRNPVQNLANTTRLYKPTTIEVSINISKNDVEAVIINAKPKVALLVKFLANTGLRISELTGIKKGDLDAFNTEYMRVRVVGKGNKTRFIFIPYALYQEVKNIFDNSSQYLFASNSGKRLSRINLYKQIHTAFSKYAHRDGVTCHTLRHFFATQKIVFDKMDYKAVSKYLGHASVSTTLNLYTHSQLAPEDTQII